MIQEWNIRPRGPQCHACAKAFEEGEPCHSSLQPVLRPDGIGALERVDRCGACRDRAQDSSPVISLWQSPYHAPDPPEPDPAPRQAVEDLLRRLLEGDETESQQPVIYVLALMLERKKLLIERDTRRQNDGTLLRVYEYRRTGEVLLIPDPGLRMDQLEPVQEQVARALAASPEAEPMPPAPEIPSQEATEEGQAPS